MYWITGARGLLGRALCKVAANDYVATGHEVDIADLIAVRKFVRRNPTITHIFNAAAFSLVEEAEDRRAESYRANVLGPENLRIVTEEIDAKLIHISTDYVFPGGLKRPLKEEDPAGPCNYYGVTKLLGEKRILQKALIIRTSWLFGDGGKNFVAKMLHMLMTQKEIFLTSDQWGRPTYALDLAEAMIQMKDHSGLYHYANQGVATKYEFGLFMRETALSLGLPVVTESIQATSSSTFPTVAKRPVYSAFDTTKIEQYLTIRSWQEALRDFLCAHSTVCS